MTVRIDIPAVFRRFTDPLHCSYRLNCTVGVHVWRPRSGTEIFYETSKTA